MLDGSRKQGGDAAKRAEGLGADATGALILNKKIVEMSEEEQAQKLARQLAMQNMAWVALNFHCQVFDSLHPVNDKDEKIYATDRMLQWMREYRDLTEE